MEWLSQPGAIAAVASLLTAATVAIMNFIRDRRSAPIERETAEMATATALTTASKVNVDMAMSINERLSDENEKLSNDLDKKSDHISLWESWYLYLVKNWELLRLVSTPPERPDGSTKNGD